MRNPTTRAPAANLVSGTPLPETPFHEAPVHEAPFHERRTVPWWWWVVGAVIAVPTTEAVVVLGPEMSNHPTALLAIGCALATLLVEAVLLILLGRSDIAVDQTGLAAGSAVLPASHVGRSRALDAVAARRLLGPGLRADAQLSLRPWIKTAVQIEVAAEDGAPYWVVATRRPAELVAALDLIRAPEVH